MVAELDAESSVGGLLCGREEVEGLLEQIQSSPLQLPPRDELSDADEAEMAALPNEYCANLYLRLSSTKLGPLVWKFVKPWLRGFIFVHPDNTQTRAIMAEVVACHAQFCVRKTP